MILSVILWRYFAPHFAVVEIFFPKVCTVLFNFELFRIRRLDSKDRGDGELFCVHLRDAPKVDVDEVIFCCIAILVFLIVYKDLFRFSWLE